jgi:transcription elongation GreA/GreB family factor
VTVVSPLGAALSGCKIGDTVSYQAPGGTFRYQVLEIRPYMPGG